MSIESRVVFRDTKNIKSGTLDWFWGDMFYISDEHGSEVDVFTVNNVGGLSHATLIAEEHFELVEKG